ncbi:hypothetical protein BJX66DRAFT_344096 [Aspergillus keveii]|uniref:Uncharacterized protein n=1 Tax=Aspergillus keveii TaxID=714993 RepID=A0ABR4FMB0_9EURO
MAKKSVSFAPYSVIVSERRERTAPTPERDAAKRLERLRLPAQLKNLDVSYLMTVQKFIKYVGFKYAPGERIIPTLIFAVELKNHKIELVQCGATIPGNPGTLQDAFLLHSKVERAKILVDRDDWRYMQYRFGVTRGTMMRFVWLDKMRSKLKEDKSKSVGIIMAEQEAIDRERYERSVVGKARKAYTATKELLGACLKSLIPSPLRRR